LKTPFKKFTSTVTYGQKKSNKRVLLVLADIVTMETKKPFGKENNQRAGKFPELRVEKRST